MNSITTQRVAFSSGVNHRVIYKIMVFQFREYLGKKCSRQNYSYFPRQPGRRNNIMKLRPETKLN